MRVMHTDDPVTKLLPYIVCVKYNISYKPISAFICIEKKIHILHSLEVCFTFNAVKLQETIEKATRHTSTKLANIRKI